MTSEIHPPPTEFTAEEIKLDDVLRFFHYGHLPPTLQVAAPSRSAIWRVF